MNTLLSTYNLKRVYFWNYNCPWRYVFACYASSLGSWTTFSVLRLTRHEMFNGNTLFWMLG